MPLQKHPRWSHNRIAAPVGEPITLAEAKRQVRADDFGSPPAHPDDALISRLITAAREHVERSTGRGLRRQTWQLASDRFPRQHEPIELLRLPLLAVQSVIYVGAGGGDVAFTAYEVLADDRTAALYPATSWPQAMCKANSVRVTYRVGYESGSPPAPAVPERLAQAMRLLIGHWYRARDEAADIAVLQTALDALLGDFTPWTL